MDTAAIHNSENASLTTAFRLLIALVAAGLAFGLVYSAEEPDVPLLVNEGNGEWIVVDKDVALGAQFAPVTRTHFRRRFSLADDQPVSEIRVRALRECRVLLDGKLLIDTTGRKDDWQREKIASLPPLSAGEHELTVIVTNYVGPAAVWVDGEISEVNTNEQWESQQENEDDWRPVRRAHRKKPAEITNHFPTTTEAVQAVWPWMLGSFLVGCLWGWKSPRFDPRHVKWLLMVAWVVLALRNIQRVPAYVGYDVVGHLEYIRYVAHHGGVPLAGDGWQMFQSPLYYLINAPIYLCLEPFLEPEAIVQWLRVIPILCGVAQVEIAFRVARRVFPEDPMTQCVAVVFAGWIPMSLSMAFGIGNEPLAGCLMAWTILLTIKWLTGEEGSRRLIAGIGCVWGLALLTKVSAVLLAPALLAAVVLKSSRSSNSSAGRLLNAFTLIAPAILISGWYFAMNYSHYGQPFAGGWDPARGIVWWQYPGYRTWDDLRLFGAALDRPVYSGVYGLWDGLYSTAWSDGFLSGVMDASIRPPWNYSFLISLAILAVVPTAAMAGGLVRTSVCPETHPKNSRPVLLFATVCVLTFLAAVMLLYCRVPIYGAAKASYLLGVQPCLGILAAASLRPLARSRAGTIVLTGFGLCWFVTVFLAFLS